MAREFYLGMERIDFFQDVVPEERSCHNAGIEKHLCYCDAWVPCDATSLPAVEHQAKNVVIPLLNDRLSKMLNKEQQSLTKHCGKAFQFASIDSAETSTQPASLQFILTAVLREFELRRHCVSFVEIFETKGSLRAQEIFGVSSVRVGPHDVDVEKGRRCVQSSGENVQWREALRGAVKGAATIFQ